MYVLALRTAACGFAPSAEMYFLPIASLATRCAVQCLKKKKKKKPLNCFTVIYFLKSVKSSSGKKSVIFVYDKKHKLIINPDFSTRSLIILA
jgi:hypothetical protein